METEILIVCWSVLGITWLIFQLELHVFAFIKRPLAKLLRKWFPGKITICGSSSEGWPRERFLKKSFGLHAVCYHLFRIDSTTILLWLVEDNYHFLEREKTREQKKYDAQIKKYINQ